MENRDDWRVPKEGWCEDDRERETTEMDGMNLSWLEKYNPIEYLYSVYVYY